MGAAESIAVPATRRGHNYIGTEHLLLGLLQSSGRVPEALAALGLTQQFAEGQIAAKLAEIQSYHLKG